MTCMRPHVRQVEQPLHAVQPGLAGRLIGVPPGGRRLNPHITPRVRHCWRPHHVDAVEGRQQRVGACTQGIRCMLEACQEGI